MVSLPKIIGVPSCGVVLYLSLANVTQVFRLDPVPIEKADSRISCGVAKKNSRHPNHQGGEVLRAEGDTLVVERFNGKEVELQITPGLKNGSVSEPGDRIEAKLAEVDHEERVLSIHEIN